MINSVINLALKATQCTILRLMQFMQHHIEHRILSRPIEKCGNPRVQESGKQTFSSSIIVLFAVKPYKPLSCTRLRITFINLSFRATVTRAYSLYKTTVWCFVYCDAFFATSAIKLSTDYFDNCKSFCHMSHVALLVNTHRESYCSPSRTPLSLMRSPPSKLYTTRLLFERKLPGVNGCCDDVLDIDPLLVFEL